MLETAPPSPKYVTKFNREPKKVTMQDGQQLIILGETVLQDCGGFRRVRRYVKGKHPHLGPLQIGWSGGWETIWECEVFNIKRFVEVTECPSP